MKNIKYSRRDFISTISAATVFTLLPNLTLGKPNVKTLESIKDVIDIIIHETVDVPFQKTVDTIKSGDADQKIKGIVTAFTADCQVIKKTIELGANLIITHEPTFYNHEDKTDWLNNNDVYKFKSKLLRENNIVVWRFHDYIHSIKPDPIVQEIIKKLDWGKFTDFENNNVFNLSGITLEDLITEVKNKLEINMLRFVGDPKMICNRIGLLVGAPSGETQINFMSDYNVDVLIAGEIREWEVSEYVRDSIYEGKKKALIIAGHKYTEEPGMKWFEGWLKQKLSGIPIHFINGDNSFNFI